MYNFIPFSSVLVRKKHQFEKKHHEDYLCWLFSLKGMNEISIHYFDRPTFYYNADRNSLSANMIKGLLATIAVKRHARIDYATILLGTLFYISQAVKKRFMRSS